MFKGLTGVMVEGDEASYLPNCQTNLDIVREEL